MSYPVKRLFVALLGLLLLSCASFGYRRSEPRCTTTPCGDVCCNDDGLVCPPCWKGIAGPL